MDDERKLTELFRSAVADAPPASFDAPDVAAAADRMTRHRRRLLAGGSGAAVVVLAVGLFLGTGGFGHTLGGPTSGGVAIAPARQSDTAGSRLSGGPFAQQETGAGHARTGFPAESPLQGGDPTGKVGPSAGSTSQGCGPADRELAVALANELPSAGAQVPDPVAVKCPAGSRSATYAVSGGTVTALLVRPADVSAVRTGGLAFTDTPSASGSWNLFLLTTPGGADAGSLLTVGQRIAAKF